MFISHLNYYLITICLVFLILLSGCQPNTLTEIEKQLNTGLTQQAIVELEEFIDIAPQNPKARMLLGKAYNEIARYNEAVVQFQEAIQLYKSKHQKRTTARLELARTYLIYGDRDSAFQILNIIYKGTKDKEILQKIIELIGDSYKTKQLTHGNSDNYSPIFSPDGTQIAFTSYRTDNGEIYLMNLNGRIQRRVTFTTDFNETSPTFLKTPNYILYSSEPNTSREANIMLQSSGSTNVYTGFNITHIHSKRTYHVLPISFGARVPRSSTSGNKIVYEANTDMNLELYLLDLNGLNLANITPQDFKPIRITENDTDEGSPTFFPDGERIMYVASRNDVYQLLTMDIDGKNEKHFNPNRYDCYSPVISPDGNTIAFVSARDSDWEIYLIDADGKNERRITNDIGRSLHPAFSPDGRYIAFVSDRSNTFHIYLMDLEQPVTQLDLAKRLKQ